MNNMVALQAAFPPERSFFSIPHQSREASALKSPLGEIDFFQYPRQCLHRQLNMTELKTTWMQFDWVFSEEHLNTVYLKEAV